MHPMPNLSTDTLRGGFMILHGVWVLTEGCQPTTILAKFQKKPHGIKTMFVRVGGSGDEAWWGLGRPLHGPMP